MPSITIKVAVEHTWLHHAINDYSCHDAKTRPHLSTCTRAKVQDCEILETTYVNYDNKTEL